MPGPGMFTRLDPYFGETGEPQSLHKYAYVHGGPVNAWDPSGLFSIGSVIQSIGISSVYTTLSTTSLGAIAAQLTGQSIGDGLIAGFQLGAAVSILKSFGRSQALQAVFDAVVTAVSEFILWTAEWTTATLDSNSHLGFRIFAALSEGLFDGAVSAVLGTDGAWERSRAYVILAQQHWIMFRQLLKSEFRNGDESDRQRQIIIAIISSISFIIWSGASGLPAAAANRVAKTLAILTRNRPGRSGLILWTGNPTLAEITAYWRDFEGIWVLMNMVDVIVDNIPDAVVDIITE